MVEGLIFAFIPIGGGMAALAAVAFLVGAAQDAKNSNNKAEVIKHVYFYLAAFITMTMVVFSSVTLLNVAGVSWVFPEAKEAASYQGPPSPLYFTPTSLDKEPTTAAIACDGSCQLTEQQKQDVANWENDYRQWQQNRQGERTRAVATAAGLSFFVVGAIAFLFHWRVIQKERRRQSDGQPMVTRAIYYWAMSLFGLLMVVIAGGFLINVLLRGWLYPNLDESKASSVARPPVSDQASVDSIITCASVCGFTDEQVKLAQEWKTDYSDQIDDATPSARRQNDIATTIPFIVVGLPLFVYHWTAVRRKENNQAGPSAANVTGNGAST